ncbi:serine protease [Aneurinibacillus uraniidurans]|uniref:serine protease n=1 Tax=Aneurinibacillus uraniidurans TaxID=2966586 RepID=UPI00234B7F25|nr:serine protease [Aneurinibacillus sp. B1]WCN36416.1 serine protease [Aneurinibacillus sp. B1]
MRYFRIVQDERVPNAVEPVGISQIMEEKDPPVVQIPVRESGEFVDFIERPLPILSDRMKRVVTMHDPYVPVKLVVLVDRNEGKQEVYWHVMPPHVECLSAKSEFHRDGTVKRLVLEEEPIKGYPMFTIAGIRERSIVVNLTVAESLLRRECLGIRLKRVELES